MRIPKMCLKMFFSHSNWVLQAILSLTVLSNCVFDSSNFDTAFLSDYTKFCSVFFRWLDKKFNEDFKNVLKNVLFSFQVGFTGDFVNHCSFKLVFLAVQTLTSLFSLTIPNFVVFILGYWIENLMRIPKMSLKMFFSHSKWVLQAILSITVLSNLCFWQFKPWHRFSLWLYKIV